MRKIIINMLALLVMTTVGFSFTACEKEDENRLSGFYLTEPWDWNGVHKRCKGLNFINKNTVKIYDCIINYRHWDHNGIIGSEYLGFDFWYFQEGSDVMQTYSVVENKIYIPNEGMILTIDGDKLYPDGSSYPYIKYKADKSSDSSKPVSMAGKTLKFVKKLNDDASTSSTFEFTDDVACTHYVLNEWYTGPFFDDPYRPKGYYKKETTDFVWKCSYVCTSDRIEVSDEYSGKDVFTKVNGKWQWEDHADYELQ